MNRNKLMIISFLLLLEIILIFGSIINSKKQINLVLNEKHRELQTQIKSVNFNFENISNILYNEKINNNDILQTFAKVSLTDTVLQNEVRKEIYNDLKSTYENLKNNYGVKQLHFHLSDNRSFLRFHRPKKYGDDLTNIRYSVKKANEENVKVTGFEEGRIFNGFRYVYPLNYDNRHLGTVEVSVSFKAFNDKLTLIYPNKVYSFMLKKDVIMKKVFRLEQSNYISNPLSDQYMSEKKYFHYLDSTINDIENIKTIDKDISNDITILLKSNKNFSVYDKVYGKYYVISFVQITNTEDQPVGYIYSYEENELISHLWDDAIVLITVGTIIIIVIIMLYINLFNMNLEIKNQKLTLEESNKIIQEQHEEIAAQLENSTELNSKLQELNATKDKFFSIVAHDLKNPFNSLLMLTRMLKEEFSTNEIDVNNNIISMIDKSANKAYKFVENLLTWSRSQLDSIDFSDGQTDLNYSAEMAIDTVFLIAQEKNIKVVNLIPEKYFVNTNLNIVNTVFRNLITNAVKFTEKNGKVEINAKDIEDKYQISVSDNGIGMSQEILSGLFVIDKNVSREGTNNESGTGLGMLICKDFIEKSGGKIWAESEEGKGSTFYFILPKCSFTDDITINNII